MKKYTVYEIEKLTDGKLSKYKLNQAIEKGELVAEKVLGDKKGRGIPKYFIYDEELKRYLAFLEDQKKRRIHVPGDAGDPSFHNVFSKLIEAIEGQKEDLLAVQNSHFDLLSKRILTLEKQGDTLRPLLDENTKLVEDSKKYAEERRELLMELANINVFRFRRKRDIMRRLNKLS